MLFAAEFRHVAEPPEEDMSVEKVAQSFSDRESQSDSGMTGATTSPMIWTVPLNESWARSCTVVAGTTRATGLPRLRTRYDVPFIATSSKRARHLALNSDALIELI